MSNNIKLLSRRFVLLQLKGKRKKGHARVGKRREGSGKDKKGACNGRRIKNVVKENGRTHKKKSLMKGEKQKWVGEEVRRRKGD